MPSPSRSLNWLSLLLALCLLAWLPAPAQEAPPVPGYRAPRPFNLPFLIRPEKWYYTPEQGMLMLCPAHAHGPKPEATAELIRLVARHRSLVPATIWVCRADQLNTLREFAPMVDRVCINPFVYGSSRGTAVLEPPWTGTSHPFLMQAQDIRLAASDRQIVACIDVDGRESRFGKRHPTFEEVQWMTLAAVGSGFQGIAWRGHADDLPYKDRLDLLTGNILRYGDELARAKPVEWATAAAPPHADSAAPPAPSPHCSALLAENHLFIVLLHPRYVNVLQHRLEVPLPPDPGLATAVVEVHLPPGTSILAAERLDGAPLAPESAGEGTRVACRFAGGGTLLVLRLKTTAPE